MAAGFVVVSALPNDSRYVSPASTRGPSPIGSRAESFTGGNNNATPGKSGHSDQSVQSTEKAADNGDSAASGGHSECSHQQGGRAVCMLLATAVCWHDFSFARYLWKYVLRLACVFGMKVVLSCYDA